MKRSALYRQQTVSDRLGLTLVAALLCLTAALPGAITFAIADTSTDMKDKLVTFYSSYGYKNNDQWHIPLRIWGREAPGRTRRIAGKGARKIIRKIVGLDKLNDARNQRVNEVAVDFLADSESRERVEFGFDNDSTAEHFSLAGKNGKLKTDRNGLVEGTITFSVKKVERLLREQESKDGWLSFRAVSKEHSGIGRVRMIQPDGLSVISDVDDTIKITGIPSGERVVLENTFFREYEVVPCMAQLYQSFSVETAFHYVSGGPWQMYTPLVEFLFSETGGFPGGSFHMKNVRTNPFESDSYHDLWKLVGGASKSATYYQKIEQIQLILEHFPSRQFILIGDSGEHDPEIFREIRQRHSGQIQEIRIRGIINASQDAPERLQDMIVVPTEC
ncbi:hypothetical protein AB833_20655 [Chromatiales bacterium (ex Bugula neritina AB1)]|nr:hypothetical protein AB833_20655 [Chromatiales bacterium (ex Bugula neritina AB1)]